jgi:acetylornithine deacetylase/succinyl-diaminopimelate desuccinylase-like protein
VLAALTVSLAMSQAADLRQRIAADVAAHEAAAVDELLQLLAIPNVASDKPNIRRNAEHLQRLFERHGLTSEILETGGNPLVYAAADFNRPETVLFYCHYDGQPVDARKWNQSDPFEPVIRGTGAERRIYGRSASDDKAPIVALLTALDALKRTGLEPTVNVRVILDGEEEASSPSLVPAIGRYADKLRADLMVILDGPGHPSGRPTIAYGARGLVTMNLTVYGPKAGVHSGNYGNWIPNPAQRLAALLASMKDDTGRVNIAGFYEAVRPLTPRERAVVDTVPDEASRMLAAFGVAQPEAAFPKLQEALQYPTLNVRGLVSAFVGENARTIIPDRATAALDLRLVPETSADDLVAKVRAHVEHQGYHLVTGAPDDTTRLRYGKLARIEVDAQILRAFRTPLDNAHAQSVVASLARTFGQPPVQLRTLGGSVPIAPFIDALGFPAILMPIVNFDNNQHEENENLRLAAFFDGIVAIAAVLRQ